MPGNASRNLEMYISAFLGVDLRSQIVKIHLRSHLFMNVGSFPSTSNVLIEDRPERFPLTCSNVELFRGGLTTSISTSNCAGTPRRSTQNFGVISQIGVCVSKRNKNYSMMGKERYGCQGGGLVSPVLRSGAGEDAGKLAIEACSLPKSTSHIEELKVEQELFHIGSESQIKNHRTLLKQLDRSKLG